ncbi:MAG: PIN/TRAM domain-containing protein [Candidatus Brocadiia bacterium]|nr:MAG: PIN/TRAM domain-containing protein [Candidatus Brocadiia bacterium]
MKLLWIFRALFFVIIIAIVFGSVNSKAFNQANFFVIFVGGMLLAVVSLAVDVLTPKKSLANLAGVFFGLLVGVFFSWGMAQVLEGLNEIYRLQMSNLVLQVFKWMTGACVCFLVISIVMRTKDDIRFVIPYVEFAKQTKGARPVVLDTSAIIDGRIADLYQSKFFDAPLVVPRFVLNELQLIADSADKLKRNRGRRGLDILKKMQESPVVDIEIDEATIPDAEDVKGVDQKLVVFTKNCNGRLATTDYNLTKVAQVREVDVLNINDLANSLKAIALPGENLEVRIIKPGEEETQGIGYLEDGTMVVVEDARDKVGRDIALSITSSLQTSAGKMIFGKFEGFAQRKGSNGGESRQNYRRSSEPGPSSGPGR